MERRRYLSLLSDQNVEPLGESPTITLTLDPKGNTFTIEDEGVGMTKDELLDNLGTLASSGSQTLLKKLEQEGGPGWVSADETFIGQFGVGFYSVFMVALSVEVPPSLPQPGAEGLGRGCA